MPTSKDILSAAQKTLDGNKIVDKVYSDATQMGIKDTGAFAKARAELGTSINSMKGLMSGIEPLLKALNAGLTELRKNEPVMRAPADAKAFKELLQKYTDAIRKGTELGTKLNEALQTAERTRKG